MTQHVKLPDSVMLIIGRMVVRTFLNPKVSFR